jgi:hypothetical protein
VVAHGPADLDRTERIAVAPDPPGVRDGRLLVRILDDSHPSGDCPQTFGVGTVDTRRRRPRIEAHGHRLALGGSARRLSRLAEDRHEAGQCEPACPIEEQLKNN